MREIGKTVAPTTKVKVAAIIASLAFHGALSVGLMRGASRADHQPESAEASRVNAPASHSRAPIPVDVSAAGEAFIVDAPQVDPTGDPPRVAGGEVVARIDTGTPGHGGDACARVPALNLADGDERLRLSPDLINRFDRDQVQRLRVARTRASWEDRRSTTHPADLTIVTTGPGSVGARRPSAVSAPSRGVLRSPAASVTGGALGDVARRDEGEGESRSGGASTGSLQGAPGPGMADGRVGFDHRTSAPIGMARPAVTAGPVAVLADARALPRDDVDSAQEVATTTRSLVYASTAGGLAGEGTGGAGGGGEPGAGAATGPGALARPLGVGASDVYDYWTSDPRLLPYFRRLHAKIDPMWADAFPRSALLELKQGTVILEMTVFADGQVQVSWPPLRPSGVDEFDRNCAEAIRRAAPFPRIPPELGTRSLKIRAPFVANNPIIK